MDRNKYDIGAREQKKNMIFPFHGHRANKRWALCSVQCAAKLFYQLNADMPTENNNHNRKCEIINVFPLESL